MFTLKWLGGVIGEAAAKLGIIKPAPPALPPEVKLLPLKTDQYYQSVYTKKFIFLHHTAGSSAASAISWWAHDPVRIATPYVIDRDGTIYQCYDPKYFAYHLGVKGNSAIEKASIGIEIVGWGPLTEKDGKLYNYVKKPVPKTDAVTVDWRGFKIYQRYTPEQIAALKILLPYLMERFKIPKQQAHTDFYLYRDPATLPPGIWSHTTVRRDKADIFPQKEIVDLVSSL